MPLEEARETGDVALVLVEWMLLSDDRNTGVDLLSESHACETGIRRGKRIIPAPGRAGEQPLSIGLGLYNGRL